MYEVEIRDEFGSTLNLFNATSRSEAIAKAKAGAKHEQGSATISDEESVIVYEFKYEDGAVIGYDDQGVQVFNV